MRRDAGKRHVAIARRAVTFGCGAVLLWCTLGAAHAALFGDDEARRQITIERQRLDDLKFDLTKQQEAVDVRIGKLEEAAKVQPLLDLFTQIEALKLEMSKLRGQVEVLNNSIENTGKRQRDMYIDLDTRLRRLEQQSAPGPAPAPVPAAPGAVVPAPASAAGPGTTAPAAIPATPPVAAITTASPGAENQTYDAAQAQRRIGNYQGAIVAFQNFIKQYPQSNLAPRAQYWIGDSYFNLRDFKLAIASQQALIKTYPDSPSVPDAMLNIASSQIEMGESITGRRTLEELVARYPVSDAADKAKRRLATLR